MEKLNSTRPGLSLLVMRTNRFCDFIIAKFYRLSSLQATKISILLNNIDKSSNLHTQQLCINPVWFGLGLPFQVDTDIDRIKVIIPK